MPVLSPNPQLYGKYARVSAIADYVELLSLKGQRIATANLADMIDDNDWDLEEPIRRAGAQEPDNANESPGEAADRVFVHLKERMDLLEDGYPFELHHGRLRPKAGLLIETSPYVALLCITLAHAYKVESPHIPYQVFEETVADVVGARGLLTADVGNIGRRAGSFDDTLERAATTVRLRGSRAAAPTYEHAQDERIDTLCHLTWGDIRPGAWTLIGQVTCATSEQWDKKMQEPPAPTWAKLLGVGLRPLVFLAVPHHVGTPMLEKLVSDREHLVLDRPRLARFKAGVSQPESDIVAAVLACEVEGVY